MLRCSLPGSVRIEDWGWRGWITVGELVNQIDTSSSKTLTANLEKCLQLETF